MERGTWNWRKKRKSAITETHVCAKISWGSRGLFCALGACVPSALETAKRLELGCNMGSGVMFKKKIIIKELGCRFIEL